ncbi:MAG: M56 family metallopeptidase [Actinobacteria bacterium]|nr:M56 family metallopeptidase [Actinomycetota bacterium]
MVWVYFSVLACLAGLVLGLSIFLLLFLAPESFAGFLGTACVHGTHCIHALPMWVSFSMWSLVAAGLAWLVTRMAWTGLVSVRASRRVRRAVLTRALPIATSLSRPVYEAADREVFALTVGFLHPIVLVSKGLREALSSEELQAVLAHEDAHASGHDNLILLLSRMIDRALFIFPGVARAQAGVRRHVEISADTVASRRIGDTLLVATSVSRVAGLLVDSTRFRSFAMQHIGAAFAHEELALERVRCLVDDHRANSCRRRLLCGVAALGLILALLGVSLYSVTGNTLTGGPGVSTCLEVSNR